MPVVVVSFASTVTPAGRPVTITRRCVSMTELLVFVMIDGWHLVVESLLRGAGAA